MYRNKSYAILWNYSGSSLKPQIYFSSSYTQNLISSGKNGHHIELNKVTIPIFSKLIFVKVLALKHCTFQSLKMTYEILANII